MTFELGFKSLVGGEGRAGSPAKGELERKLLGMRVHLPGKL